MTSKTRNLLILAFNDDKCKSKSLCKGQADRYEWVPWNYCETCQDKAKYYHIMTDSMDSKICKSISAATEKMTWNQIELLLRYNLIRRRIKFELVQIS